MKLLPALFLTTTLLSGADVTPWEDVGSAQGDITVTLKNGKKVKRTDKVTFQPADLWFASNTQTIPRAEIKEVVVRRSRPDCCDPLWAGVSPLLFSIGVLWENPAPAAVAEIVLFLPVSVAMASVTGPPLLIAEAFRRLKPQVPLYRVAP